MDIPLHIQIEKLFEERNKIHDNDPSLYQFWEKFADILGQDENKTIQLLNDCIANQLLTFLTCYTTE